MKLQNYALAIVFRNKKSSRAKCILRPARASIRLLYQISSKRSIISPFLDIYSICFVCFCSLHFFSRKLRALSSLIFIRHASMIMFGHCFNAVLIACSSERFCRMHLVRPWISIGRDINANFSITIHISPLYRNI